MNILMDINHPAHVHLLRNVYAMLVEHGNNVLVVVKEIPSAMKLLDLYGIPYINIGKKDDAIMKKGLDQLVYDKRLLKKQDKKQSFQLLPSCKRNHLLFFPEAP